MTTKALSPHSPKRHSVLNVFVGWCMQFLEA